MEVFYNGLELASFYTFVDGHEYGEQSILSKIEVEKAILIIKIINNTINYLNQNYTVNIPELQSGSIIKKLHRSEHCFGFDCGSGTLAETVGSPFLVTGIDLVRTQYKVKGISGYKGYYLSGIDLETNTKTQIKYYLLGFYDYSLKRLEIIEEITRDHYLGDSFTPVVINNSIIRKLKSTTVHGAQYSDIVQAMSSYRPIQ